MEKLGTNALDVELTAVIVAVTTDEPRILTVDDGKALPSGPFESGHRSLQIGLRSWVERQTHHPLGYLEQLYTFADRDRVRHCGRRRAISISYLGLTRETSTTRAQQPQWRGWYQYFPWEDWRSGAPSIIEGAIVPQLRAWARAAAEPATRRERKRRIELAFGLSGQRWNEELVLQRYELLYEAGLIAEAGQRNAAKRLVSGQPMVHDHRRILATGIARLRAKIKYRPVFFELMPKSFTLLQLQRLVEALAGQRLHKQNFRRLIEQQRLVEETGEVCTDTGGRPAKLVRFRRDVRLEREIAGSKLPLSRFV